MKNFKTTTYQHAFEWAEAERAELRFKSYPVVKCLMQAGVRLCDVAEGRSEGFYIKEVYAL